MVGVHQCRCLNPDGYRRPIFWNSDGFEGPHFFSMLKQTRFGRIVMAMVFGGDVRDVHMGGLFLRPAVELFRGTVPGKDMAVTVLHRDGVG